MTIPHAHHLLIGADEVAGNHGRGRIFFVPGSLSRARAIAEHFIGCTEHDNPRKLSVFLGTLREHDLTVDVGVVPTGMGCPSLGIVVTELIELGVRRLVRVGSAGTLQSGRVGVGDLVIATAAVRDESSSDAFAPRDVPAVAHPDWVTALSAGARRAGMAERTFLGLVHTKDTLYGREFPAGPLAGMNEQYMAVLRHLGVLASEMESSHLFMLAERFGPAVHPIATASSSVEMVKAGTVLAIIGDDQAWASPEEATAAEGRAVEVAVAGALELMRMEGDRGGMPAAGG